MDSSNAFRTGDTKALVDEYLHVISERQCRFEVSSLKDPRSLFAENILAVHYADGGAQGEGGAVNLLYRSEDGVHVLYGNYLYGNLDLDVVIQKLPMLECLDTRNSLEPPYPFGGRLDIPSGWRYLYMGAMNHFFARDEIIERAGEFIKQVVNARGGWLAFDAVAWFCGAPVVAV